MGKRVFYHPAGNRNLLVYEIIRSFVENVKVCR